MWGNSSRFIAVLSVLTFASQSTEASGLRVQVQGHLQVTFDPSRPGAPPGQLTGQVNDENGRPVAGVAVRSIAQDAEPCGPNRGTTTDSQGRFCVVTSGSELELAVPGFRPLRTTKERHLSREAQPRSAQVPSMIAARTVDANNQTATIGVTVTRPSEARHGIVEARTPGRSSVFVPYSGAPTRVTIPRTDGLREAEIVYFPADQAWAPSQPVRVNLAPPQNTWAAWGGAATLLGALTWFTRTWLRRPNRVTQAIEPALRRGPRPIHVLDAHTGLPIRAAEVERLIAEAWTLVGLTSLSGELSADASHLKAGEWRIRHPDYESSVVRVEDRQRTLLVRARRRAALAPLLAWWRRQPPPVAPPPGPTPGMTARHAASAGEDVVKDWAHDIEVAAFGREVPDEGQIQELAKGPVK